MAKSTEQLIVEIRAQADQALADMKRLEKMAEELEQGVDVPVKIDSAGVAVARDLTEQADRMKAELEQAKVAAERLGAAMGPELRGKVDMNAVLGEFKKLGLTMDDVATDADELAAAVKAIDDVKVDAASSGLQGFGTSARNAKGDVDGISDSARGANSALANMVGNSAQELGALGGAAGGVGVALGQMAEYAADARLGGEGLTSVLGAMTKVAVPIAAISLALAGVNSVIGAYKRQAEQAAKVEAFNVENAKDFVEWARQGADIVDELIDKSRQAQVIEVAPNADQQTEALKLLVDEGENLYDLLQRMKGQDDPFNMRTADEGLRDVSDALLAAGENAESFFTAASDPAAFTAFVERLEGSNLSLADQAELISAVIYQRDQYAAGLADAAKDLALFGDATEDTAKTEEEAAQAAEEHKQQILQLAEALKAAAIATTKAEGELLGLSSAFSQMGVRGDALSAMFDLGNAPELAAGRVRDINIAIGELDEALEGIDVADVLAGDVKADAFLDAIDALAPQVQAKVTEAFSTGGPEAATAMANSYIDQVTAELGGKFTREQVAQLLGLEDIEATVAVALELSSIENARRQLAILTGISGETPYTASIALALDAGTITGEQAQALVQAQLGEAGVAVPSTLAVPATAEAIAAAEATLGAAPVEVPTAADTTGAEDDVQGFRRAVEDETVTAPVDADTADADRERDRFMDAIESAKPVVTVDANTKAAIATMLYLKILSALLAPEVKVTADVSSAAASMTNVGRNRTATITADASTASAERELNSVARTREAVITARVVESDVARWYRINGRAG